MIIIIIKNAKYHIFAAFARTWAKNNFPQKLDAVVHAKNQKKNKEPTLGKTSLIDKQTNTGEIVGLTQ